jgi:N-acetylglucosamine transport system permease protein
VYHHKYRLIVPFLAPALLLYGLLVLWPYTQSFYVALTDWKGVSANRNFVGLDNFRRLIQDPQFWNALRHNGAMLIVLPLMTLSIALLFAALFTQGGRGVAGASFYRVVFFFPQVMAVAIVAVLWNFVYHPTIGLANGFLKAVGLDALQRTWLGDAETALPAVVAVVVWQAVGFYMVLFMAGIQSIPISFYEAAVLDGANGWSMFWRITLPLVWGHVQVALIYLGIIALDFFTIVQVMTIGGPNRASDVVARYMYETAFSYAQFGYATAIGVSLLLMTLTLSLLTFAVTRREQVEF